MMKVSFVVATLVFSMLLVIPGSNGDWDNGLDGKDWGSFIPEAKKGLNQKWKIKFKNSRNSKTTHNTENTAFHHIGESSPARRG